MSTVLIPTFVEDLHAYAVAVRLEQMGHRPLLWHCSDMPERAAASVRFAGDGPPAVELHGLGLDAALADVDVFWNRRIGPPVLTTELLACDREIALRENERFVRSLQAACSDGRFAVNAADRARAAEDKVLQLGVARRVGLALPPTLVSNDPAAIRRFVVEHRDAGAVVKNFSPMGWQGGATVTVNFTARVTSAMLPRDAMLRLTPSIWQGYVDKAYEVRLTCMGAEQVAAALHSQQHETSRTDWRTVAPDNLGIARVDVPAGIAQRCTAMMRELDLRFGCFDFIVTPDGQWVFLELNQMGQFLWVEEAGADFPLLQMFCDFIVAKDPAWRYARSARSHGEAAFGDVQTEACERMLAACARHSRPERPPHVYVEPGDGAHAAHAKSPFAAAAVAAR
jgi:glutathione synthase/RimK-type ligase-like ATP-grasp enzyme